MDIGGSLGVGLDDHPLQPDRLKSLMRGNSSTLIHRQGYLRLDPQIEVVPASVLPQIGWIMPRGERGDEVARSWHDRTSGV